ncbi:hypothetical protein D187_005656 [Cystobacter fuscus DSM 2262]|uniref:Uncharacterized protein n=1 Tax=Cystobacter fuscus (strain ATCC 25194 / DSM 2262 / NBRC 100088 / M29) TaxID=1242864 RepID=S9PJL4_CYSF2|nr:hypothetical protein D187_005656 [Cystobacter fuscus DSM 2262]
MSREPREHEREDSRYEQPRAALVSSSRTRCWTHSRSWVETGGV